MALFLLLLITGFLTGIFLPALLPWWTFVPIAALGGLLLTKRPGVAFVAGFLGTFLLWLVFTAYLHTQTDGLLSNRMAELLPLAGSGWLMVIVTSLLGGLLSGLAAWSGWNIRKLTVKDRRR